MSYGVPYKGSKSQIAEFVLSRLPRADTLYDLFCGGCAVTHAAMLSGRYRRIVCNDLDGMGQRLFLDGMAGRYRDETRWISREEFMRLRDTDPYVSICWSFGNNQHDYLYSREIEPYKRAIHYATLLDDPGRCRSSARRLTSRSWPVCPTATQGFRR